MGRSGDPTSMEACEAITEEGAMVADYGEETVAAVEMSGGRETTIDGAGSWQRLGDVVDRITGRIESD